MDHTIILSYQLARKPLLCSRKGHFNSSLSPSTAFIKGMQMTDICKIATGSQPIVFVKRYRMDVGTDVMHPSVEQ